jgi:hypothetical protein
MYGKCKVVNVKCYGKKLNVLTVLVSQLLFAFASLALYLRTYPTQVLLISERQIDEISATSRESERRPRI